MTPEERDRIKTAVERWFGSKLEQAARSALAGKAQAGTRSSVTGGLHLEGFEQLIIEEIGAIGVQNLRVLKNRNATLVGWYRSSKSWDLLVLQDDLPVLSVEYKSMEGSEGKNLNNRADEMFGVAEDAREAEAHGLLPKELRRAYVFIMEATEASTVPVAVGDPTRYFRAPATSSGWRSCSRECGTAACTTLYGHWARYASLSISLNRIQRSAGIGSRQTCGQASLTVAPLRRHPRDWRQWPKRCAAGSSPAVSGRQFAIRRSGWRRGLSEGASRRDLRRARRGRTRPPGRRPAMS